MRDELHARAAKLSFIVIRSEEVYADGTQAPGFVVLLKRNHFHHPYVTYFWNAQDKGFTTGHYLKDREGANADFAVRAERYTRHHGRDA